MNSSQAGSSTPATSVGSQDASPTSPSDGDSGGAEDPDTLDILPAAGRRAATAAPETRRTEAMTTVVGTTVVGDEAPDFELPDQHGQRVLLSSLRGTKAAL